MKRRGTAIKIMLFKNEVKMSREFILSRTRKVTLHVQAFLNHWGLKRRVRSRVDILKPQIRGVLPASAAFAVVKNICFWVITSICDLGKGLGRNIFYPQEIFAFAFFKINFYWRTVALQRCVGFCYPNAAGVCIRISSLFWISFTFWSPQRSWVLSPVL